MKIRYAFLAVFGLIAMAGSSQASGYTFTTVEFPGADWTVVNGVSGSTVIGYYYNNAEGSTHRFIYDGSTFKTVDCPWGMKTSSPASPAALSSVPTTGIISAQTW